MPFRVIRNSSTDGDCLYDSGIAVAWEDPNMKLTLPQRAQNVSDSRSLRKSLAKFMLTNPNLQTIPAFKIIKDVTMNDSRNKGLSWEQYLARMADTHEYADQLTCFCLALFCGKNIHMIDIEKTRKSDQTWITHNGSMNGWPEPLQPGRPITMAYFHYSQHFMPIRPIRRKKLSGNAMPLNSRPKKMPIEPKMALAAKGNKMSKSCSKSNKNIKKTKSEEEKVLPPHFRVWLNGQSAKKAETERKKERSYYLKKKPEKMAKIAATASIKPLQAEIVQKQPMNNQAENSFYINQFNSSTKKKLYLKHQANNVLVVVKRRTNSLQEEEEINGMQSEEARDIWCKNSCHKMFDGQCSQNYEEFQKFPGNKDRPGLCSYIKAIKRQTAPTPSKKTVSYIMYQTDSKTPSYFPTFFITYQKTSDLSIFVIPYYRLGPSFSRDKLRSKDFEIESKKQRTRGPTPILGWHRYLYTDISKSLVNHQRLLSYIPKNLYKRYLDLRKPGYGTKVMVDDTWYCHICQHMKKAGKKSIWFPPKYMEEKLMNSSEGVIDQLMEDHFFLVHN